MSNDSLSFGVFAWAPELAIPGYAERLEVYNKAMSFKSKKVLKGWRGSVKKRSIGALIRVGYRNVKTKNI